jgi:hypothetical protein
MEPQEITMSSIAGSNSLFEIDRELDSLLDAIQEEIATKGQASEECVARFAEFCKAHGEKVDRIGRFVRSMESRTNHCRAEAQRLYERARAADNKSTRAKSMVLYYLKSRNLQKIEGVEFTLQQCQNSQDTVRILDEDQIPERYKRVYIALSGDLWERLLALVPGKLREVLKASVKESTPDNDAIKAAAAGNESVPGAEVKRGDHVRVT